MPSKGKDSTRESEAHPAKDCAVNWKTACLTGLVLALMSSAHAEESPPLVLAGPPGVSRKDMEASAKALAARCKEFGYEGVTAKTIEVKDPDAKDGLTFRVEVSCPTGVTPKMAEKLTAFACTPCKEAVLRFGRELSDREAEQFEKGKTSP